MVVAESSIMKRRADGFVVSFNDLVHLELVYGIPPNDASRHGAKLFFKNITKFNRYSVQSSPEVVMARKTSLRCLAVGPFQFSRRFVYWSFSKLVLVRCFVETLIRWTRHCSWLSLGCRQRHPLNEGWAPSHILLRHYGELVGFLSTGSILPEKILKLITRE